MSELIGDFEKLYFFTLFSSGSVHNYPLSRPKLKLDTFSMEQKLGVLKWDYTTHLPILDFRVMLTLIKYTLPSTLRSNQCGKVSCEISKIMNLKWSKFDFPKNYV